MTYLLNIDELYLNTIEYKVSYILVQDKIKIK